VQSSVCRPWSAPLSDATGTIHNTCGGIVIVRKVVILCFDVYRHCSDIQIKKTGIKNNWCWRGAFYGSEGSYSFSVCKDWLTFPEMFFSVVNCLRDKHYKTRLLLWISFYWKGNQVAKKIVLVYSAHLFIIFHDLNVTANISVIHETKILRIIAILLFFFIDSTHQWFNNFQTFPPTMYQWHI